MRILADGNKLKRIESVDHPYYHGDALNDYDNHGSQTSRMENDLLKSKIDLGQTLNQDLYMDLKWSKNWRYCGPTNHPFDNKFLPLTYTTYDLNFIRKKYMGF